MQIEGHGIAVQLPSGWEAEINRRPEAGDDADVSARSAGPLDPAAGADQADPGASATAEPTEHPVTHMANFGLPGGRGDFGSGAVEIMRTSDVLVCLVEYGPEDAGSPLFAHEGIPQLSVEEFAPSAMQRTIEGMSGTQAFFTVSGRAFCVYAVLGSHARRRVLVPEINGILASLEIGPDGDR